MNLEYYLKKIIDENSIDGLIREKGLYEDLGNTLFEDFFALAHHEINRLLSYLNSRLRNGHYNAAESRQLLKWIKIVEDTIYAFKKSETPIEINEPYFQALQACKGFLLESGGSPIPVDFEKVDIIEYAPIFSISSSLEIKNSEKVTKASLKLIGEGSYAKVFRYKDEFYNKYFVLKRANKDLLEKELIRFKREFETMNLLKTPYVIEVYRYQDETNEYIMEYADQTIYDFISRNNGSIELSERISLVNQIFRGFEYVYAKGYLHRDISLTNILIQKYDGLNIIKISDFGLVKTKESTLTSFGTELKGSLNDSALEVLGFDKYSLVHETYALTRLVFFIMTGRTNLDGIKEERVNRFVTKGIHPDNNQRYQNFDELKKAFREAFL
ncbi:protein kinase family protein [Bacillaceae bacterium S4-13-58]